MEKKKTMKGNRRREDETTDSRRRRGGEVDEKKWRRNRDLCKSNHSSLHQFREFASTAHLAIQPFSDLGRRKGTVSKNPRTQTWRVHRSNLYY